MFKLKKKSRRILKNKYKIKKLKQISWLKKLKYWKIKIIKLKLMRIVYLNKKITQLYNINTNIKH